MDNLNSEKQQEIWRAEKERLKRGKLCYEERDRNSVVFVFSFKKNKALQVGLVTFK